MEHNTKLKVTAIPQPEINYKPCKMCGSTDYDLADGDVDDDNNYEPSVCDICCFGEIKKSGIPIH